MLHIQLEAGQQKRFTFIEKDGTRLEHQKLPYISIMKIHWVNLAQVGGVISFCR